MKAKDNLFKVKSTLNIRGNLMDLTSPKIMGILNITPDSFYAGSRSQGVSNTVEKALQMIDYGAEVIDIGGYSTRPGADDIPVSEEIDRVIPIISALTKEMPKVIISIDTFRAEVAKRAVIAGASIINDVSGGNLDQHVSNGSRSWCTLYTHAYAWHSSDHERAK